jgi:hypothetical protein
MAGVGKGADMIVLHQNVLDEAFANILADTNGAYRFYGVAADFRPPKLDEHGTWNKMFLSFPNVLCCLSFNRGDQTAALSIYNSTNDPMASISAARNSLLTIRTAGVFRFINAAVHETNKVSLKCCNRIFGSPWGIIPGDFWDRKLGEYVAAHHFRATPIQIAKNMGWADQIGRVERG